MLQDSDGYLWIGTWSGLIRYDGYNTTLYSADNSGPGKLRSNKIISLFESDDKTLWVGTMVEGLFAFDRDTQEFKQYIHDPNDPQSISNNNVWGITQATDGSLWLATEGGLNRMEIAQGKFRNWRHDEASETSLSFDFVTNLHFSQENELMVATEEAINIVDVSDHENLSFDRRYFTTAGRDSYLDNYVYTASSITVNGSMIYLWTTKSGIKLMQNGKIENYDVSQDTPGYNFIRCMTVVDGVHPFVIVGSELGISTFDLEERRFKQFFGNYDKEVNLSHNTITSLFIDRSGVLWAGTKKGINKYDSYNNNFRLFLTSDFDPTNSIISDVVGDANGKIWLSTLGGGLFVIRKDKNGSDQIQSIVLDVDDKTDFTQYVQKLAVDKKGRLWLGTAGSGVLMVDKAPDQADMGRKRKFGVTRYDETTANNITDNYVMSLEPSSDGGMWIGSWSKGLNYISENGKTKVLDNDILVDAPIVVIEEVVSGELWVGTRGGGILSLKVSEGSILSHTRYKYGESGLSSNFINTIFSDSKNRIWVGTEDGLNLFDSANGRFKAYTEADGLPSKEVVGILEDEDGRYWLTYNQGLAVVRHENDQIFTESTFDNSDRIQGGFFYNEVLLAGSDGRLYFGGSNGLNIIDQKSVNINPIPPKTQLERFFVYNREVLPGEKWQGRVLLTDRISKTETVELAHDQNSISFEFTALHFAFPNKNQFAYKLQGFDTDWNYTHADRRFANYTNLANGSYNFIVKSSNDDAVWDEEGASINIVILPPWWKTNEALIMYLLIAGVLLFAFRKAILMRMKYENDLRFARLEKENVDKLNKARLQFFTNISHEFRTPLTLILGPLEKLLSDNSVSLQIKGQLRLVSHNASRLRRLITQLLDFRKAEAGNLALRVAEGNFYQFIKEIKLSFDGLAEDRNIEFGFKASSNLIKIYFDRDQFEKIIFNLLSNAFKHTPDGGKIELQLIESSSHLLIRIADNGSGIPEGEIDRIFDRFYTGEHETALGTGIGLALCRSLVELHHGSINVTSKEHESTVFEVRIPKGKDHFTAAEIIDNFKDSEHLEHYLIESLEEELPDLQRDVELKNLDSLKSLLIVEDNIQVREFLKDIFVTDYIVFVAENGERGLEMAREESPDLIISDVMMPIMDGFTLCKHLKSDIHTSHIPLILLTARTSYVHQVEGLKQGADDYLTKPFNVEVLKLKIANLLRLREQLRTAITGNDTLNVEPKALSVSSADETFIENTLEIVEKNMSNAEFSVVEFGKELGFSRMQLFRKLKQLTGLAPNEYIRMLRIKRAAQMLQQGDLNVTQITYSVGFSDIKYFRKCFKAQFGLTPTQYAKQSSLDRVPE